MKCTAFIGWAAVLLALGGAGSAQSAGGDAWALRTGQVLRYEIEVRQSSKPITRMLLDLVWLVQETINRPDHPVARGRQFAITATVERLRLDLRDGGPGFEVDTNREELGAVAKRKPVARMITAVGKRFSLTIDAAGELVASENARELKRLVDGLPNRRVAILLSPGIQIPSTATTDWSRHDTVTVDGKERDVLTRQGRVVKRTKNRVTIEYRAAPRDRLNRLLPFGRARPPAYMRSGTATFDTALGCLLKARERFRVDGKRFSVLWRYRGDTPPAKKTPVARVAVCVVSRKDKTPLAGATVRALGEVLTTDADGRAAVLPETRDVLVSAADHVPMRFELPKNRRRYPPPYTLGVLRAARLAVVVTNADGKPERATVDVQLGDVTRRMAFEELRAETGVQPWLRGSSALTDENGRATLTNLPAGGAIEVIVWGERIRETREVRLAPGETRHLAFSAPVRGSVTGRLVGLKIPVGGIYLSLAPATSDAPKRRRPWTWTKADGSFSFDRVDAGRWVLEMGQRRSERVKLATRRIQIRKTGDVVSLGKVRAR